VVANNYNDSISVIDTASGAVRYEHDLRPYLSSNEGANGGVGGTFPFAVVVKGNGTAYVSSDRNREVVVVDISSATAGRLVRRIKLDGNALGMTLDGSGSKLFVAQDNADQVAVNRRGPQRESSRRSRCACACGDGVRIPRGRRRGRSPGSPIHRRRHVRRDALARWQDALTRSTRAPTRWR